VVLRDVAVGHPAAWVRHVEEEVERLARPNEDCVLPDQVRLGNPVAREDEEAARSVDVERVGLARPHHFATIQLARDTGASTSMATVTLTTNGANCVFAAQAVVQPG
jgi:hypothetical protein